jgi:outer membrane lipopolysaccharide assembly protein LptE/RlpB
MRRIVVVTSLCLMLALNGCGYHLAGQGRGSVPEDVSIVNVTGADASARSILPAWRNYVSDHAKGFVVGKDHADAELRLGAISESFNPVSYDASGVAITYRLSRSGSISLWRKDVRIWNSGPISVQGDVYAVGGPTSIEASRNRLSKDLDRQWMREAWLKLSSGF